MPNHSNSIAVEEPVGVRARNDLVQRVLGPLLLPVLGDSHRALLCPSEKVNSGVV
jgi:hypothetical protein